MSIIKISLFTILASFVVFGQIQTSTAVPVTYEKFLEPRYILAVAILDPSYNDRNISCGKMVITAQEDGRYIGNYTFWVDGRYFQTGDAGKFINSELHYVINHTDNKNVVFTVEGFIDTPELMIFPKDPEFEYPFSLLTSLEPVASMEAKSKLETRAKDLDMQMHVFDNTNCS